MTKDNNIAGKEDTPELAVSDAAGEGGSSAPVSPDGESSAEQDDIQALRAKLDATHERWVRTAADLDNLRKRTRRDAQEAALKGRVEVLLEILPVLDSIDLALSSSASTADIEGVIEGIRVIKRQFETSTARFDIKAVDTDSAVFDPNYHEAVAQVYADDHEPGQIVSTMRKGYTIGGKLLRPALVVVSRGPLPPREDPPQAPGVDTTDDDVSASEKAGLGPDERGETEKAVDAEDIGLDDGAPGEFVHIDEDTAADRGDDKETNS